MTVKPFAALLLWGIAVSAHAAGARTYIATILNPGSSTRVSASGMSGDAAVGTSWLDRLRGPRHAVWWPDTSAAPIDLHPPGFLVSDGNAIAGNSQVGYGDPIGMGGTSHALLWHGTADSVIDLHPAEFERSAGSGISSTSQGGSGYPVGSTNVHALLWRGTAESVVDLHPAGFAESLVWAVSDTSQIGWGLEPSTAVPNANYRALLWKGAPASVVNLHPDGFRMTIANGGDESSQVGYGIRVATDNAAHALLWRSAAESYVDLHPDGLAGSIAESAAGIWQAGRAHGPTMGGEHAFAWRGSADSAVDLHTFLDQTGLTFTSSLATGVNVHGDVVGWGDTAEARYAIKWTLVPEPRGALVFIPAVIAISSHFRRARRRREQLARRAGWDFRLTHPNSSHLACASG